MAKLISIGVFLLIGWKVIVPGFVAILTKSYSGRNLLSTSVETVALHGEDAVALGIRYVVVGLITASAIAAFVWLVDNSEGDDDWKL